MTRVVPQLKWTTLVRVTASSNSGSAPERGVRKTQLMLTVRAGSSRQARWTWACDGVSTEASPIRSTLASACLERVRHLGRDHGPARLAADHQRVRGSVQQHRRGIEEAGAVERLAAREQLGARVDGVLDLPVHPVAVVGVDQRAELGRRFEPGTDPQGRAPAGCSASRNGSATAWCTCTRSTDPHDWPAPANALAATSAAAHSGSTPASTSTRWLPAPSSPGRITSVDARVGGERARGALVAVQQLQDLAQVEQLDHPLRRRAAPSRTA